MDSDGDTRNSSQEEKNPKRRMKTPFQLETLERVYAEDRYPTEAVRAELSLHLNLSDKQLQMWFCHRRLKDRKVKDDDIPAGRKKQKTDELDLVFKSHSPAVFHSDDGDTGNRDWNGGFNHDLEFEEGNSIGITQGPAYFHHRSSGEHETETILKKRNESSAGRVIKPRIATETVALAAMGSQLGGSVYDDGPTLSLEFDPLPPGAFDSVRENKSEHRVIATPQRLCNEGSAQERQGTRPSKAGGFGLPPLPTIGAKCKGVGLSEPQNLSVVSFARIPQEFQFLPEQRITREESNHRQIQLKLHPKSERSYELVPACRVRSLSSLGAFTPSDMHLTSGVGCGSQQERGKNVVNSFLLPGESSASGLNEAHRRGLYNSFEVDGQMGVFQSTLQMIGPNQPFVGSESIAFLDEHEFARTEKKRKSEDLKLAKESEANVKRIKRDLERQEIMIRKREEQMRKELEKQDRDKRKEAERAIRERQREEERIQREQRREIERQEKMVMKENKKMEKQHRRDEMRKAKEAARLKATLEKAAAKKLSKESMDTVDDEQLELLEAATAQGLFSVNDSEHVLLKRFPPASVRMKLPLLMRPWTALEETVGHLFMVWRFLTTFADVIGLWPFTLDEFAQALHDFDARLLGEIHVSLIKMIVKNIEDATQAAASVTAGSQNSIALACGGHPQIVEAAHEWGFDIQEWGQHVNSLTWPEILRQFALAAGYGPKWRKCNKVTQPADDVQEHNEQENAVTTLRSGAAVANAVALMQGRGVGHLRRCRYRLTPGTVKYAAFHVLSLEGSKGLTILEVADKIQKSGLRDLTTSKTPEASIAAALSRDTSLFERVAPSTYCVRSAFRKDLEDTEAVLQSARDRIRLFQNGLLDVEGGDKETDEAEEGGRDEEYYSDGHDVEDRDVGNLLPKGSIVKDEMQAEELPNVDSSTNEEMEIDESQVGEPWVQGLVEGEYSDLSVEERLMALVALVNVVNEGNTIRLALEARMEAASALKRQMWAEIQAERRRHKEDQSSRSQPVLLAIGKSGCPAPSVAVDGSPAPVIPLDEKNESGARTKTQVTLELNSVANGPYPLSENVLSQEGLVPQETVIAPGLLTERSRALVKADIGICAEELYVVRSLPLGLDRRRNRYWQFWTCAGGQDPSRARIYFESSLDGHWEVIDTEEALDTLMGSLDIRGTREAGLHAVLVRLEGSLRQAMRAASSCGSVPVGSGLDIKSELAEVGVTFEGVEGIGSSEVLFSGTVESSALSGPGLESPRRMGAIAVNNGDSNTETRRLFGRFKDFEQWIYSENSWPLSTLRATKSGRKRDSDLLLLCTKCHDLYWAIDKHCQLCHSTVSKDKQDLHARECKERIKVDPSWESVEHSASMSPRLQILKANIINIEVVVPSEGFKKPWDHQGRKAWASSVKCAVTPSELLQALTELESRVRRDWLSSSYETTEEALSCVGVGLAAQNRVTPWVPHTVAAIFLRMMAFDAALSYGSEEKKSRHNREGKEDNNGVYKKSQGSAWSTPDLPVAGNQGIGEDGEILGDLVSGRGKVAHIGRKSRGSRTSRCLPTNAKVGGVKKDMKCKLQIEEEDTVAGPADWRRAKGGGKVHGRRGRPRGRGPGRGRGRSCRGGHRDSVSVQNFREPSEEKYLDEFMFQEASTRQVLLKQSMGPEEDPENEDDAFSRGEWEGLEDQLEYPQEIAEDGGNTVVTLEEDEDDEDDELHEGDADGQGRAVDEDDQADDLGERDEVRKFQDIYGEKRAIYFDNLQEVGDSDSEDDEELEEHGESEIVP